MSAGPISVESEQQVNHHTDQLLLRFQEHFKCSVVQKRISTEKSLQAGKDMGSEHISALGFVQ